MSRHVPPVSLVLPPVSLLPVLVCVLLLSSSKFHTVVFPWASARQVKFFLLTFSFLFLFSFLSHLAQYMRSFILGQCASGQVLPVVSLLPLPVLMLLSYLKIYEVVSPWAGQIKFFLFFLFFVLFLLPSPMQVRYSPSQPTLINHLIPNTATSRDFLQHPPRPPSRSLLLPHPSPPCRAFPSPPSSSAEA